MKLCPACTGHGYTKDPKRGHVRCPDCRGTGLVAASASPSSPSSLSSPGAEPVTVPAVPGKTSKPRKET